MILMGHCKVHTLLYFVWAHQKCHPCCNGHTALLLTLGTHVLRGLQYLSCECVCVCLCVCLSCWANLWTGASTRLTEGTSGLSDTFFTK